MHQVKFGYDLAVGKESKSRYLFLLVFLVLLLIAAWDYVYYRLGQ